MSDVDVADMIREADKNGDGNRLARVQQRDEHPLKRNLS